MDKKPDTELYELLVKYQSGDSYSGWLFTQNRKIKAIINGRLNQYRRMFHWVSQEDFQDVECGLTPRIYELAFRFELPEQANDGRIISYFAQRIMGEADFLLKKITGMKSHVDEVQGKTYLKLITQDITGLENELVSQFKTDEHIIDSIEGERIESVLMDTLGKIDPESNDRIWLRCFMLRLRDHTWAQIAKSIGYRQTDYAWLKDNTSRFISRLKHGLIMSGEQVNYRICGVYTDPSVVSISLFDSNDRRKNMIWLKEYDSYADLDKVEAKLGDIFRQHDVTYVVMNDVSYEDPARVIVMRYLVKRESFVETVDLSCFRDILDSMPDSVNGVVSEEEHKYSLLLTYVKRAIIQSRQYC